MGSSIIVTEIDKGWRALLDAVRAYKAQDPHVKVGVLDDGGKGSADHDGLTVAELAALMEFGSEDGHIPARSFVGSTFDANKERYIGDIAVLLGKVYEGQLTVQKTLAIMGLRMVADINRAVRSGDGIPPPNAPSTVAAKGSSRTLIDTARMVGALTYAVILGSSEAEKGGPGA